MRARYACINIALNARARGSLDARVGIFDAVGAYTYMVYIIIDNIIIIIITRNHLDQRGGSNYTRARTLSALPRRGGHKCCAGAAGVAGGRALPCRNYTHMNTRVLRVYK